MLFREILACVVAILIIIGVGGCGEDYSGICLMTADGGSECLGIIGGNNGDWSSNGILVGYPAYPNPFVEGVWIPFGLTREADVTIEIRGPSIKDGFFINLGRKPAGDYRTTGLLYQAAYWDARNSRGERVQRGIYRCFIRADGSEVYGDLMVCDDFKEGCPEEWYK